MPRFIHESLVLFVLLATNVDAQLGGGPRVKISDSCGVDAYYSSLAGDASSWTRQQIADHIKQTHTNVPIYTNTKDPGQGDTWEALMQLESVFGDNGAAVSSQPRSTDNDVRLIYKQDTKSAVPFGGPHSWMKEHLWPVSRMGGGVSRDGLKDHNVHGPDFSDVHNLRATTAVANEVRGEKYFGECGVLERQEEGICTAPAEAGSADTCSCRKSYQPPEAVRGEIARALLYMDLRYDGSDEHTEDLTLTDCPFSLERTDMAYLSQLLDWHEKYPPTPAEMLRNDLVCANWQGNRNPFVDHVGLARKLHGEPAPLPTEPGRLIYEACESVPTEAPTFPGNDCESLQPGDVFFYLLNSDDPDQVAFFPLADLPGGLTIFVTDNAWTGADFDTQEGTYEFTVPDAGIGAGTIFGYGPDLPFGGDWTLTPNSGPFSLNPEGEQVFLYCREADGSPRPLSGVDYSGNGFLPAGLVRYDVLESALPENLEGYALQLPQHDDNFVFAGPNDHEGDINKLRLQFLDPANYQGNSESRIVLDISGGIANEVRCWTLAMIVVLSVWGFF